MASVNMIIKCNKCNKVLDKEEQGSDLCYKCMIKYSDYLCKYFKLMGVLK